MIVPSERAFLNLMKRTKELCSADGIHALLKEVVNAYGLQYLSYASFGPGGGAYESISTFPSKFTSLYRERRFDRVDPFLSTVMETAIPCSWTDLRAKPPHEETVNLFEEVVRHGIGPSGVDIPLVTVRGERRRCLIASSEEPSGEWERRLPLLVRDLAAIGQSIYAAARRHSAKGRGPPVLSRRQQEFLWYAAMGMNVDEASAAMEVSQRTAKRYREETLRRLEARSTAHAVARAMSMGIISIPN